MEEKTYWQSGVSLPRFARLSKNIQVDVVIIGAGLTGITAAYLLKKEGVKVALIDRERCAAADTAHTTAHLTYVTDNRLNKLVKTFGKDGAKAFWEAGITAIIIFIKLRIKNLPIVISSGCLDICMPRGEATMLKPANPWNVMRNWQRNLDLMQRLLKMFPWQMSVECVSKTRQNSNHWIISHHCLGKSPAKEVMCLKTRKPTTLKTSH